MKRSAQFTLLLVLLVMGLALGFYYWNRPAANAHRYQMLSTWGLGRLLAERFPGSRVLVLSNPFTQQKEISSAILAQEENRIQGLEKGLAPSIQSVNVVYPELKPEASQDPRALLSNSQTTTPLSLLIKGTAYDDLLAEHPETDIVVSLIGLPAQPASVRAWQKPGSPRFAFLFPDFQFLGGPQAAREAVKSGKLAAFVINKPGVLSDVSHVGRLNMKEFDRHFLVVHQDNIDPILAEWPNLLSGAR